MRPRSPRTLVFLLLASLGALALPSGCASGGVDPELAALPADERIQVQVERALRADGKVDAERIRVEVHEGEVVLAGVVSSPEEARRALRIAGDVDGVVQLVNRLRVLRRGASAPARRSGPP